LECMISKHQQLLGNFRLRVCEEWQHEDFCIPEEMAAISITSQPLGRNAGLFITSGRLIKLKQVKSDTQLKRWITFNLNVTVKPKCTARLEQKPSVQI